MRLLRDDYFYKTLIREIIYIALLFICTYDLYKTVTDMVMVKLTIPYKETFSIH